jgi:hypothetical protein
MKLLEPCKIFFIQEVLVDTPSGGSPAPVDLIGLINVVNRLDDELTVYVPDIDIIEPSMRVILIDENLEDPPVAMYYLLEVHLIKSVLRVWAAWRVGREPTNREACDAIAYYVKCDAYQPVE